RDCCGKLKQNEESKMETEITLVDVSGAKPRQQDLWSTVVLPKARVDQESERLADIARPADGRRASAVNHPQNKGPIPAFAPGIDVHIVVLKPGEQSVGTLRNSSHVDMCIRGTGTVESGGKTFQVEKYDVWN